MDRWTAGDRRAHPPRHAPPPLHRPAEGQGWASAAELEWGREGWMDTVAKMADPPLDLVVAADA